MVLFQLAQLAQAAVAVAVAVQKTLHKPRLPAALAAQVLTEAAVAVVAGDRRSTVTAVTAAPVW